jgi:hypothetical protein
MFALFGLQFTEFSQKNWNFHPKKCPFSIDIFFLIVYIITLTCLRGKIKLTKSLKTKNEKRVYFKVDRYSTAAVRLAAVSPKTC